VTFGGSINGTGTSATSIVIDAAGGVVTYGSSNTYDGGTTLKAGTLLMGATNSGFGGIASTLTVNGGTIDFNATTANRGFSVGNITGSGGTILNNGTSLATLTIGSNDTGGGSFAGVVLDNNNSGTGTIALKKVGLGRVSLSGSSTYSGGTIINGGSLFVNNTTGSGLGKGAVSVITSTTANTTLGGSGTIGGITGSAADVTLTGSSASLLAVLSPGAADGSGNSTVGTLAVGSASANNNVTFGTNSQLLMQLDVNSSDLLNVYGNLSLASTTDMLNLTLATAAPKGQYTLVNYTGTLTGVFNTVIYNGVSYASTALPSFMTLNYGTLSNSSITVTVPEPTSFGMIGGTVAFALRRVRRSKLRKSR